MGNAPHPVECLKKGAVSVRMVSETVELNAPHPVECLKKGAVSVRMVSETVELEVLI